MCTWGGAVGVSPRIPSLPLPWVRALDLKASLGLIQGLGSKALSHLHDPFYFSLVQTESP